MKPKDANNAQLSKAFREIVLWVALHYAKLGLALTPGYHDPDGKCTKHPSVLWNRKQVENGEIVGATTDPDELRRYFLHDGRLADICVHTVPSGVIGVECDRAWKKILVKGEDGKVREQWVWIDGLKNLLDFLGGDLGTDLMALSKRGLHAYYLVGSEVAQKILTQAGQFLPGVDVRGGANSGGVLVETNGVCPHRRWVRGKPRIDYSNSSLGVIVGVEDYGNLRFDDRGRCVSGLPMLDPHTLLPAGIGEMPMHLLDGLLLASRAVNPSDVDKRALIAMQEMKSAKAQHKILRETKNVVERGAKPPKSSTSLKKSGGKPQQTGPVVARLAPMVRPWLPDAQCTCGRCERFGEARELLAWIPPEVNHGLWILIIWSTSHVLGHSDCGARLVAAWSGQSQIASRCDPELAAKTYVNDRRYFLDDEGREWEDEDADESGCVDMTLLPAVAVLCGAPKRDDVELAQLEGLAHTYAYTLITECAVDADGVIRGLLVDVFDPIEDAGSECDKPKQGTTVSNGAVKHLLNTAASDAAKAGTKPGDPIVVRMSDVEPEEIRWLWMHRVARRRLCLLTGVPGVGKTYVTMDSAARVSTGTPWPDGSPCEKGSVVLVTCEDDPADTLRPRLDACGANVEKVHVLKGVNRLDRHRRKMVEMAFTLEDLGPLEQTLERLGDVRLVVIDPVGSYFGTEHDSYVDTQIRALLAPLAMLAARYDVAILLVAHRRKSKAGTADESTLGGVGFSGIARSTLHLFEDPDEPGRKLLLPGKNNVGPPQRGLGFRLAVRDGSAVPAVEWDRQPVLVTADELMARLARGERRRVQKGATEEWLREVLAAGAMDAGEVQKLAKQAGFQWRTVQRASEVLGVRTRKAGFGGAGGWQWSLPGHEVNPAEVFKPLQDDDDDVDGSEATT